MKSFAQLFSALDETNKTNEKVIALKEYFAQTPPEDAVWGLYFLSGRKPRALVQVPRLYEWAVEETGIPAWLWSESYDAVGDFAEAIALLLPESTTECDIKLHALMEQLLALRKTEESVQKEAIVSLWRLMSQRQRFLLNKLLNGAFRVGVSHQLVARALSQVSGIPVDVIMHRLMGTWEPTPEFYRALLAEDTHDTDISRPYPFFLAYPIEGDPSQLGPKGDWAVEWKWDGIRSQLIRRAGETFLWSRGEELIADRFPEVTAIGALLPDGTIIDGEILAWRDGQVMRFGDLQLRIGRKVVSKKLMTDVPVVLLAYDLLEFEGEDVRERPYTWRREQLSRLIERLDSPAFILSPAVQAASWDQLSELRNESRDRNVEGFMLKRSSSPYRVGRQRGDWWTWKIDPYTIDAVLIYAQRGSGKRAAVYTDYTFGVWQDGKLVPVAKAYSGLTDAEIAEVDAFIRKNTVEKFGPVRTVKPALVFELAFEDIRKSSRHKSGIAVRFPRILRWRHDKPIEEADTLENLENLLNPLSP